MSADPVDGRVQSRTLLTIGALGVVFGDIGTSPIYTIQTVFNPGDPHPVPVSADSVFGIVSLIFWAVTIIVTIKYVLLILRADNHGEGGILTLITLIRSHGTNGSRRTKVLLAGLGIFDAFSVARQAVQLGYLPRLRILHASSRTIGQIYVPWITGR
ncbi:K+ transporter [Kribbella italica]|uniref:K+ transporter n=1 Tax=Kribbella italica TaxID=1540520 RepID=A0A7W9J4G1_9ACTN|nr:K+ transporter [Kribbella italica]